MPIEVEKVLNDIYPLLRAVQPAELNYTLNALATRSRAAATRSARTSRPLDGYLKRLNPQIPALVEDLDCSRGQRHLRRRGARSSPQTLRNTVKTGNTLVAAGEAARVFDDVASFSGTAKTFLDDNGDNIVRLGELSEPQLRC